MELPPASRWGLGGALCLRFAQVRRGAFVFDPTLGHKGPSSKM